jgi:hypothetical protein
VTHHDLNLRGFTTLLPIAYFITFPTLKKRFDFDFMDSCLPQMVFESKVPSEGKIVTLKNNLVITYHAFQLEVI